jgi:hypothetical protein
VAVLLLPQSMNQYTFATAAAAACQIHIADACHLSDAVAEHICQERAGHAAWSAPQHVALQQQL